MEECQPVDGASANFSPRKNGERKDCTIELTPVQDWGIDLKDLQQKPMGEPAGVFGLKDFVKQGRPVCMIIMPQGLKFEASSKETFFESMKRLSSLRPIIVVFGGK